MAFRMPAYADNLDTRALENAGFDQRGTVGKRPQRRRRISCDYEAALDAGFSDRARDEGIQLGKRGDTARRNCLLYTSPSPRDRG